MKRLVILLMIWASASMAQGPYESVSMNTNSGAMWPTGGVALMWMVTTNQPAVGDIGVFDGAFWYAIKGGIGTILDIESVYDGDTTLSGTNTGDSFGLYSGPIASNGASLLLLGTDEGGNAGDVLIAIGSTPGAVMSARTAGDSTHWIMDGNGNWNYQDNDLGVIKHLTATNINVVNFTNISTRSVWIPASSLRAPPVGGASFANRGNFGAWEFIDNQDKQIVGSIRIPDYWDESDTIALCICWESTTTSQTGLWDVTWGYYGPNDDVTAGSMTVNTNDTSSSTAQGLINFEVCCLTNATPGKIIAKFVVVRDGNAAGDTLGASAFIHGVTLISTTTK